VRRTLVIEYRRRVLIVGVVERQLLKPPRCRSCASLGVTSTGWALYVKLSRRRVVMHFVARLWIPGMRKLE
jgi:hypothetical protein